MKRRIAPLFLLFALLSGCMMVDGSELLTLPQLSEEHAALLSAVGQQTKQGWSLTAPLSGSSRSTVQMMDFYGDGIPEAVVYLYNKAEFTLRVSVYGKTGKSSYSLMFSIDNPGDQFDRAELADLNGDGITEIVLGIRGGSSALMTARLYTIANDQPKLIFDSSYTGAAVYDMTGDGRPELLLLHNDESGENAYAELYTMGRTMCTSLGRVPLSSGVAKPDSLLLGRYNDKMAAAVVEGSFSEAGVKTYVTDCLAYTSSGFVNLSYSDFYGCAYTTLRTEQVMCGDINFDANIEFPIVTPAPAGTQNLLAASESSPGGSYICWYRYDENGDLSYLCASYGSMQSSWYYIYPGEWRGRVYTRSYTEDTACERTDFIYDYYGKSYTLLSVLLRPSSEGGMYGAWTRLGESGGKYIYALLPEPGTELPKGMKISSYSDLRAGFAVVNAYGEVSLVK